MPELCRFIENFRLRLLAATQSMFALSGSLSSVGPAKVPLVR